MKTYLFFTIKNNLEAIANINYFKYEFVDEVAANKNLCLWVSLLIIIMNLSIFMICWTGTKPIIHF